MDEKRFLALVSGGKDSIYTIGVLKQQGYVLVGILYMENTSTIDSFMFQTVGSEIIKAYGECLKVPIIIQKTNAIAKNQDLQYTHTKDDEVEDLLAGIKRAKEQIIQFKFISTGAIQSVYQKNRVDYVCEKLNLHHLAPLWGLNQKSLLDQIIAFEIQAFVVKIASNGFGENIIGLELKELRSAIKEIINRNPLYKWFNFCGEGGEYETIVLDAPFFVKRINISEFQVLRHPDESEREWNVYYMKILKFNVIEKTTYW